MNSLPQASVIRAEDKQRWMKGVLEWHRPRSEWHARRLLGVGGSEIGPILRHYLGNNESGFSSIERVAEQKLLMRLPEYETLHMRRGNVLEPLTRLAFMHKYGAQQDAAAIAAMARPHGRPGYEWLLGNPDDIVTIGGKRWLPDYKVPSSYDEEVAFDYEAQIHHYELGAKLRGIKCDGGLLLVKLDIAPELALSLTEKIGRGEMQSSEISMMAQTIARANVPGLRVMAIMVPTKKQLHVDILDCGADFWRNHVLKGDVPRASNKEKTLLLTKDLEGRVAVLQQQFLMAKAATSQLENISKAAAKGLEDALNGVNLDEVTLPMSMVKATSKATLNKEKVIAEAVERGATTAQLSDDSRAYSIPALLAEIKALGGNVESEGLYAQQGLSAEKAKAFLESNDIPTGHLYDSKISIGVSTKKADSEARGIVQQRFQQVFDDWVDRMSGVEDAARLDTNDALDYASPLFDGVPEDLDVFEEGSMSDLGKEPQKTYSMRN